MIKYAFATIYFEKTDQIENFSFHNRPSVFKMVEYTKKVTKSNHKKSPVILNPKSPQSPDFTIKKEPNIFDSQEHETGFELWYH